MKRLTQEGEDGVFEFDNIDKLLELFSLFNHNLFLENPGYLWRGQRKESWDLIPTLERRFTNHIEKDIYKRHKEIILQRFKNAAKEDSATLANRSQEDWWLIGQLHGLKTPLLDWTSSPYIAAFFAFHKKDTDEEKRSIYFLHRGSIQNKVREIKEKYPKFICPYYGDNQRLISQSSQFSVFPLGDNIEDWVRKNFSGTKVIVLGKMNVPNSIRIDLLHALNRMNIHYASLFPNIDGAAKYVNMSMEIPKYIGTWDEDA